MRSRMTAATLGAVLLVLLTGCAPEAADPTPTPTSAFASEEEAFAAAEETYRAYVDAVNAERADPQSADPQQFLIGKALEADIETQRMLQAADVKIVGPNLLAEFQPESSATDLSRVTALICIDASQSRVIDGEGADVTPSDREPMVAVEVSFLLHDDAFAIAESQPSQVSPC